MDILGSLDVSLRGMTKVSCPLPFCCGHFLFSGHFSSRYPVPSTSPLACAEAHKAQGNADRPSCRRAEWKCRCGRLPGCPLQLLQPRLLQYVVPAQRSGMLIPLSRCRQALAERQERAGWKEEEEESGATDSQEQGRSPSECCWAWPGVGPVRVSLHPTSQGPWGKRFSGQGWWESPRQRCS